MYQFRFLTAGKFTANCVGFKPNDRRRSNSGPRRSSRKPKWLLPVKGLLETRFSNAIPNSLFQVGPTGAWEENAVPGY